MASGRWKCHSREVVTGKQRADCRRRGRTSLLCGPGLPFSSCCRASPISGSNRSLVCQASQVSSCFPRKDSQGRKGLLYVSSTLVPGRSNLGKHSLYAGATGGGRRCQNPAWDAGCSPSPWPGVEAVKLHWQEYQCLVPGGYVIYQLRHFGQRTSPLGASSGKLTGGAVGKMTLISRKDCRDIPRRRVNRSSGVPRRQGIVRDKANEVLPGRFFLNQLRSLSYMEGCQGS